MFGVDTITLTQPHEGFKVATRNKLEIQPYTYNSETANFGSVRSDVLFYDAEGVGYGGQKAYYNYASKAGAKGKPETLVQISINGYGLKVQCSLPKLLHGQNKDYLPAEQTIPMLKQAEGILKECGVITNLLDANISRLDINQNAKCKHIYEAYTPFVAQINHNRGKLVTYSNEYIRTGNQSNQACFYVKDAGQRLYRMESRLLVRSAVETMAKKVGSITPTSIADREFVEAIYKKSLVDRIKLPKIVQQYMSIDTPQLMLEYLNQKGYEDWFLNANRLALELMEVEGIDVRLKTPSTKDLMTIHAQAKNSITPIEHLEAGNRATLNLVDQMGLSKANARMRKMALRREFEKQTPLYYTDKSKKAISNEFIEKYLTV